MGERKYRTLKPQNSASAQAAIPLVKIQNDPLPDADAALQLVKLSLGGGNRLSLGNLHPNEELLLLTPYLHLPPAASLADQDLDPFEPFGRQLCRFSNKVRHMPYVAKRGVIQVHEEMIDKARGVLIVICDSSASDKFAAGDRLDLVADQEWFARKVGKMARQQGKPCGLVLVGLPSAENLHYGHRVDVKSWTELEKSADLVFKA
jgi:hypothetical protein